MTKRIIEAKIINNTEIADKIFHITLQTKFNLSEEAGGDETYKSIISPLPGQFINVYLDDKSMLLPRPISICSAENDKIVLVYRVVGKGTEILSGYREGADLRISTPLGNGYDLDAVFNAMDDKAGINTIVIAAGGLGVPPMVELAKALRRMISGDRCRLIAFAGFQAEPFLTDELKSICDEVYICTDNGTVGFHGNILEMIEALGIRADYYLSCGPKPMLRALAGYCEKNNIPLQVSMEERMGCGYGACVGCTCKLKDKNSSNSKLKKICLDGPVFFGDEVIWDE